MILFKVYIWVGFMRFIREPAQLSVCACAKEDTKQTKEGKHQ